jgi:hypothetical protein
MSRAVCASPGKKDNKSSWFGSWMGGGKKKEEELQRKKKEKEEEDQKVALAKLKVSQTTFLAAKPVATDTAYSFDLSLDSNAVTFSLTSSSTPVVTLNIACTSHATYRPNGDLTCALTMTCLAVKDEVTRSPIVPHLVSVVSHTAQQMSEKADTPHQDAMPDFPLAVSFVSHPSKNQSSLTVTSLPLVFCWNPLCVSQLLDLVTVPAHHEHLSVEEQVALTRRNEILKTFQKYKRDSKSRQQKKEALAHVQSPISESPSPGNCCFLATCHFM